MMIFIGGIDIPVAKFMKWNSGMKLRSMFCAIFVPNLENGRSVLTGSDWRVASQ